MKTNDSTIFRILCEIESVKMEELYVNLEMKGVRTLNSRF